MPSPVVPAPAVSVLALHDPLGAEQVASVAEQLESRLRGGTTRVVLDLSEAPYVDSGGWGLISLFADRLRRRGGGLAISGLSPNTWHAYDMLGMRSFVAAFELESAAIDSLAG